MQGIYCSLARFISFLLFSGAGTVCPLVQLVDYLLAMGYRSLIVGDANVVRFWQASQLSRPQLVGVPMKSVTCFDTLDSAMKDVSDEYDYIVVSLLTSFILDEASSTDVRESCRNVVDAVMRPIVGAAKRAAHAEVYSIYLSFLI